MQANSTLGSVPGPTRSHACCAPYSWSARCVMMKMMLRIMHARPIALPTSEQVRACSLLRVRRHMVAKLLQGGGQASGLVLQLTGSQTSAAPHALGLYTQATLCKSVPRLLTLKQMRRPPD